MAPKKKHVPRPFLRTAETAVPHPSTGRGWSTDMRELAVLVAMFGQEQGQFFELLRGLRFMPSVRTRRRYVRRLQQEGHVRRYVRQGNRRAKVLHGHDGLLLVMCRLMYPKSSAAEINAFIWNAMRLYPGGRRFYTNSEITKAEDRFGFSRKRAATLAHQALLPLNLVKHWCFHNMPYPHGKVGIVAADCIDIDEAAILKELADRHEGKASIGIPVTQEGNYGREEKSTLLFAISGDPVANERWYFLERRPGTDIPWFVSFIMHILQAIGPGTPQRRRCFLMDNLTTHWNVLVAQLIRAHGHRILYRVPYRPNEGPVEYAFNSIQQELMVRMNQIKTEQDLHNHIAGIINTLPGFANYFAHCGY